MNKQDLLKYATGMTKLADAELDAALARLNALPPEVRAEIEAKGKREAYDAVHKDNLANRARLASDSAAREPRTGVKGDPTRFLKRTGELDPVATRPDYQLTPEEFDTLPPAVKRMVLAERKLAEIPTHGLTAEHEKLYRDPVLRADAAAARKLIQANAARQYDPVTGKYAPNAATAGISPEGWATDIDILSDDDMRRRNALSVAEDLKRRQDSKKSVADAIATQEKLQLPTTKDITPKSVMSNDLALGKGLDGFQAVNTLADKDRQAAAIKADAEARLAHAEENAKLQKAMQEQRMAGAEANNTAMQLNEKRWAADDGKAVLDKAFPSKPVDLAKAFQAPAAPAKTEPANLVEKSPKQVPAGTGASAAAKATNMGTLDKLMGGAGEEADRNNLIGTIGSASLGGAAGYGLTSLADEDEDEDGISSDERKRRANSNMLRKSLGGVAGAVGSGLLGHYSGIGNAVSNLAGLGNSKQNELYDFAAKNKDLLTQPAQK